MGGRTPHHKDSPEIDETETLTLALRYEKWYASDPLAAYHDMIGNYGKEKTASIVKWMETFHENRRSYPFIDTDATIDESAGLDPNHPLQGAA